MPFAAPTPAPKNAGFSLVELSIVIAILGLLVGGIMVGTSLLRQSELQTVISDYTKYSNAVAQFRQQYGGLPGDLIDATNFWGDDAANCADAAVTDGTPGTCNGNADERIGSSEEVYSQDGTTITTPGTTYNETYRAWQQLVLANYINVSVTGVASGSGAVPGTNVPKARITNAGWTFGYKMSTSANANQYDQDLSNFLAVGVYAAANPLTQGAALPPQEAWKIDTKIDNGLPGTGRVVTLKPAALANCATSATDATAAYNISYTSAACSLNMSLTLK